MKQVSGWPLDQGRYMWPYRYTDMVVGEVLSKVTQFEQRT
jgi:hypothetical protein